MELPANHPFAMKKQVNACCLAGPPVLSAVILAVVAQKGEGPGHDKLICRAYAVHMWRCLQVSRDEEKLQKARLEIKRGLPLQDLANNRGFPDSPRMQPQVALFPMPSDT